MSFDALPRTAWPNIAAVLPLPWPAEAAAHDLRWYAAAHGVYKQALPAVRDLAARWGWGRTRVHDLIASNAWKDEARAWEWFAADKKRTSGGQRADTSNGQTPVIDETADNERTTSGQEADSRARASSHPIHPTPQKKISEPDPTPTPDPEPMPMTPDDHEATADGYRNGRTGPNLSTDTEPDPPHLAPDGRPVPPTWSALLGPVVQRLSPREAGAAANVIRALLHVPELAPRYLLAIEADAWKFQRGIGGEARANLLADLSTRAGWRPGCLAVAPVRRLTMEQALDLITDEESYRWQDGGSLRDPVTGVCIVPPLVAPTLTMLPGGAR